MILVLFLMVLTVDQVSAANIGVANSVNLGDLEVQNGDIICETDSGFALCQEEYSPQTYGVFLSNPGVALVSSASANFKPVLTQGTALVRVSSANGSIETGDYVSSSVMAGVGQKAVRSGYALGVAQEPWTDSDPTKIGLIQVSIQPKPAILTTRAGANLIQLIKEGIDATYLSPLLTLRYTLASLITVSSVVLGFWFFARVAHSGVQAIGRNPLAGKTIQMGIMLNVLITVGVMATGLAVAYLLLVF